MRIALKPKWFMTIMGDNLEILDVLRDTDFYDDYLNNRQVLGDDTPDQITSMFTIGGIDELFELVVLIKPLDVLVNFYCDASGVGFRIHTDLSASEREYSELELDDGLLNKTLGDKLNRIKAILEE